MNIFIVKYMGGAILLPNIFIKEIEPGVDAFDPGNILVFANGPKRCSYSGASRMNITSKYPLTKALGGSRGGGFWGPKLKFSSFDAIVIIGKALNPVYLWINDGKAEIRNARHIWGMTMEASQAQIRKELYDKRVRIALIGPGGEN